MKIKFLKNPLKIMKKEILLKYLKIIGKCNSYDEFYSGLCEKENKEKGDLQELLIKIYLEIHKPLYEIKNYYSRLLKEDMTEFCEKMKEKEIKLPSDFSYKDKGVDGYIIHKDGKISLIQVKFRKNKNSKLDLSVFGNMSLEFSLFGKYGNNIYLISNIEDNPSTLSKEIKETNRIKFINYDLLSCIDWKRIKKYIKKLIKKSFNFSEIRVNDEMTLFEWQQNAVNFIFGNGLNFGRKTVVSATGSGKSIVANEVLNKRIEEDFYRKKLILVPTLSLLSQAFLTHSGYGKITRKSNFLLIGSDIEDYDCKEKIEDIPFVITTDSEVIRNFLLKNEEFTIISTYQSLNILVNVLKEESIDLDITISDECHICVNLEIEKESNFGLVCKENFPSKNLLFFTATPKVFIEKKNFDLNAMKNLLDEKESDEETEEDLEENYESEEEEREIKESEESECEIKSIGMNNKRIFGERFEYTFYKAIDDDIISNYHIVTGYSFYNPELFDEDLNPEFNSIFLKQSLEKYKINSCLVFSNNHKESKKMYEVFKRYIEFIEEQTEDNKFEYSIVLMKKNCSSTDKRKIINRMNSGEKLLVFNVRVYGLGTDIPSLQSIFFNGNKNSSIDIIQNVGRCLRKHRNKDYGYILLPCLIDPYTDLNEQENSSFDNVRNVLTSLGRIDKALTEMIVYNSINRISGESENKKEFKSNSKTRLLTFENIIVKNCNFSGNKLVKKNIFKDYGFELTVYDRFCKNKQFCRMKRIEELAMWINENNRKPRQIRKKKRKSEEDIEENSFANFLYKPRQNERKILLKKIEKEENKEIMRKYFENKKKEKVTPQEKFNLLYEESEKKNSLPLGSFELEYMSQKVKIGQFLDRLKSGKQYKKEREGWLNKLMNISLEIKNQIENTFQKQEENKKKEKVTTEEKFNLVYKYIIKENKLPSYDTEIEYKSQKVKLGIFLSNLKSGKRFKKEREGWLNKLMNISLEIKNQIENTLQKQEENKKKEKVSTKEKFNLMYGYTMRENKLPSQSFELEYMSQKVKIGNFLSDLKSGKRFKREREEWLNKLYSISEEIRKQMKNLTIHDYEFPK
jgi:superfamily II DNA or RNA helicase